jgi:membrane protease YdiL (CAAX protease family)
LVEVFIAGLFFCWVLWRTGSLWVPIACHTLYNSSILFFLWMIPLPG